MDIIQEGIIVTNKSSQVLNIEEDSGFSSIAGSVASESVNGQLKNTIATSEDDIPLSILRQRQKEEKKRMRLEEAEKKKLEDEMYERKLQEKRYKSLMHLLDKSQFYSNYILKKIDDTADTSKTETPRRKSERKSIKTAKAQVSPEKKKKTTSRKKQTLGKLTTDMKRKLKQKANLTQKEIQEFLAGSSDEENNEPVEEDKQFIHPKYFNGILHDYQKEGFEWLRRLNLNGLSGILGDEMGLGKTIQIIALFCHLIENRQTGPYLIVAPLSTIPNWLIEFERFSPDLPVVLFYGNPTERRDIIKKINQKYTIGNFRTQPIVLTTFETPVMEDTFLRTQTWRYIVIDEGHRIKNPKCLLVKVLKSCKSMNRLLMTGTPLQNNLTELWSLLNFLLPDLFNDLAVFESWFDVKELQNEEGTKKFLKQEEEKNVIVSLREILKPFMLRRVKSDVNLQIPAKKEVIVYAPITELQRDLYRAVLSRDIHKLLSQEEEDATVLTDPDAPRRKRKCVFKHRYNLNDYSCSALPLLTPGITENSKQEKEEVMTYEQKKLNEWGDYATLSETNCEYLVRMKFLNRAMLYKQIINHPYLVYHPLEYSGLLKIDESIVNASGKLLVLDRMLVKLKAAGHKILLFSTMTKILDVLEEYLSLRDYRYVRLDGEISIDSRKTSIADFNNDPNIFLFLISTRAGGVGLNLASADTVIIFDSDWNPQADIQAMARCHRIGQTRPVVIYKLCAKGTIDEKIISRGDAKRKLEKLVIAQNNLSMDLGKKETLLKLRELLDSKECEVVSADKDVFTEEELDKLLDRSDLIGQ